jgi:tripartite-type tricarboxylate transporter receptor subunit TctC
MRRALAAPDVKDKLEALNMQVRGGSGEELRALLAADIAKWDRLVKERGIRIAQ